jgi:hypothetical protein
MIVRDFGNPYNVQDWTLPINMIPNTWGTIQNLNLFETEPVAEQSVVFQEVQKSFGLIVDRVRGDRSNVNTDYTRKIHSLPIPHFPLQDQILPKDVQGKSSYVNLSEAETLDGVRMRRMERIRNSHAVTLERARALLLTSGAYYAPTGTISGNAYTEMNVTPTSIDFALGTSTTNLISKIEACISAIQDNAGAISITGVVALCAPDWFAKLIAHPQISTAYQYYTTSGAAEPLRKRLSPDGSATSLHRVFDFGGVQFIEMRDKYKDVNGNVVQLIPAGTAAFVPTGTDYFRTYFAPAERFGLVNTLGMEVYMFEFANAQGTSIDLETESNFLNFMQKPAVIIQATTST